MNNEDVVKELRKRFKDADVSKIEGTVAVQIDLKDDNYSNVYLEVKDKVLSIEPYDYYDRIAKVTVASKELLDIVDKKIDVVKAFSDNLVSAEGDLNKCVELLKLAKVLPVKEAKVQPKEAAPVQAKVEVKPKETAKPKASYKAKTSSKSSRNKSKK